MQRFQRLTLESYYGISLNAVVCFGIFGPIRIHSCLNRFYLRLSFRERLGVDTRKIERPYMLSE
jgi:hypothetical protein